MAMKPHLISDRSYHIIKHVRISSHTNIFKGSFLTPDQRNFKIIVNDLRMVS
jgi:hypothetical protein